MVLVGFGWPVLGGEPASCTERVEAAAKPGCQVEAVARIGEVVGQCRVHVPGRRSRPGGPVLCPPRPGVPVSRTLSLLKKSVEPEAFSAVLGKQHDFVTGTKHRQGRRGYPMMTILQKVVATSGAGPGPAPAEQARIVDKIRVALVDDDDRFREMVKGGLADNGFEVTAFAEGGDLLRHLAGGGAGSRGRRLRRQVARHRNPDQAHQAGRRGRRRQAQADHRRGHSSRGCCSAPR